MRQVNPYTNPIDRLGYRFRGVIVVFLVLSLPVFLISYGWMIKQLFYAAPGWITAIIFACHASVWIGISSLFDSRQERDQQ